MLALAAIKISFKDSLKWRLSFKIWAIECHHLMYLYVICESFPYNSDVCDYFTAFAHAPQAFLLDSGKPQQAQGQYDIFSAWPTQLIESDGSDIATVKQRLSKDWQSNDCDLPFSGGWMGFACYELGYALEPKIGMAIDKPKLPLFFAAYYAWAFIIDHNKKTATLVYEDDLDHGLLAQIKQYLEKTPSSSSPFSLAKPFTPLTSWPQYQEDFNRIKHYLNAGDCYQVNYAQAYTTTFNGPAFSVYKTLRNTVPSPFMAYANVSEQQQILSISPERFLKATAEKLETKPIKGTAGRSSNKEVDAQIALCLQQSEKNRAENLMIVDLLRNDFGRYCETSSIAVDELFAIESYANVHHLVSTITGKLNDNSFEILPPVCVA